MNIRKIDQTDRDLLELLQDDASLTQAEIARRVGLSPASVHERIRKLERRKFIRGYVALLDDARVGNDITAFIEVAVDHPKKEKKLVELMLTLEEVQECHYVAGEFTCLLKVKVADRHSLRELVLDRINELDGVRQTRTMIVLQTIKETPRMRLPATPGNGRKRAGRVSARTKGVTS